MPVLRMENASKRYKTDKKQGQYAVRDLSLTVEQGEFVFLIGSSVSLPGSERDRVGPLRSGHRASGGRGDFFFILPAREPCFFGGF